MNKKISATTVCPVDDRPFVWLKLQVDSFEYYRYGGAPPSAEAQQRIADIMNTAAGKICSELLTCRRMAPCD